MSYCSTDYDSNYKYEVKICSLPVAVAPGVTGSIPGWVRIINFCPGIGYVSFFCDLCCLRGGSDIVLTTHSGRPALVYLSSVLVQRLLLPLLYDKNFCGIGLEHKALQWPRRRATGLNQDTMKKRVEGNTWCGIRRCHT